MSRFALVEPTGRVAQVEDETFEVAAPYEWIECGDDIDMTYTYVDGEFVPRKAENSIQ